VPLVLDETDHDDLRLPVGDEAPGQRLKNWNVSKSADVHADGEEQPGVEQPAEDRRVELQVHEEQHHRRELDHHHDDQRRDERRAEPVGVRGVDLERR
jgi:hypothetical protein